MFYGATLGMETRVASFFQPDSLLLAQYLETVRRKADLEPEKMLMLAVLEDGIFCFRKNIFARDRRGRSLFRDAEEWILANSDCTFCFENICEVLGIAPNYLRQGLLRWKQRQLARRRKARRARTLRLIT